MNGRDVVRLGLLSAPRRPIVTKHARRTSGVPLRVNCSCATRKQLRGPLLSVKNASPCADLELATHKGQSETCLCVGESRIVDCWQEAPTAGAGAKTPPTIDCRNDIAPRRDFV